MEVGKDCLCGDRGLCLILVTVCLCDDDFLVRVSELHLSLAFNFCPVKGEWLVWLSLLCCFSKVVWCSLTLSVKMYKLFDFLQLAGFWEGTELISFLSCAGRLWNIKRATALEIELWYLVSAVVEWRGWLLLMVSEFSRFCGVACS